MNEMTNNFSDRFQRAIRIDTDFNDLGIVDTFVSSETADKTIIDMCQQIKNGQQPTSADLQDHITADHDKNAGINEEVAWNCRDLNGQKSYQILADIVDQRYHSNVLELACGSGVLLDLCNHRFNTEMVFSGVDISQAELQLARNRLSHTDIKLHQSAAQNLNFIADSSVDVVLCHWALTLMNPITPVLNEIRRVLSSGGKFAALVNGPMDAAPGYNDVYNLIYKYVQTKLPRYGEIDLGDPRTVSYTHLTLPTKA